jgi:hypothetical protein
MTRPIDFAVAAQFLKLLDPTTETFLFSSFDDDKERTKRWKANTARGVAPGSRRSTLERMRFWMAGRHKLGANMCVSVNAMRGTRRRVEEVAYLRAVFAEMDQEPIKPWPIAPSIVVETSPGRHHLYWLLDRDGEQLSHDDFDAVQQRIVEVHGGDKNAKDLARTLRMPGSWNLKPERPEFQVRIVSAEGFRYSRADILRAFPLRAPKPKKTINTNAPRALSPRDEMDRARNALMAIPVSDDRDEWLSIGMAIKHAFGDAGFDLWDAWSQQSPHYEEKGLRFTWNSFRRSSGKVRTIATVFHLAKQNGWKEAKPQRVKTIAESSGASSTVYEEVKPKKRGRPKKNGVNGNAAHHKSEIIIGY